jgi:glycosyltransferase 2 family protein
MKILINLTLFLLGCGLLIWAINSVDTEKALELLFELDFGFFAVLLIYSLITWLDTLSWKNDFLPETTTHFSNQQLWIIRQIGEAYNVITPLGTLGGEPVKAHLLKEHCDISIKQSLASLIIAKTTFLTALIIFCIPGIYLIIDSAKIPENFKKISILGMTVFSLLILLFFIFQVTGTLGKICSWLAKKTNNNRLNCFLTKLFHLDKLFSAYYQSYTKRVFISIFFALLGWILGLAEVYLIFHFLGFSPSIIDIWIIEAMGQLIRAGSFFIPLSIGVQEGGMVLVFSALGYPGSLGLAASLIGRVKQFIWVALGLGLGWIMAFKQSNMKPQSLDDSKH